MLEELNRTKVSAIDEFTSEMLSVLGTEAVRVDTGCRTAHSYDAYLVSAMPDVVLFPQTSEQVGTIIKAANRYHIPFLARGAGSGYAGGSVPLFAGIVISLQDMNQILELNSDEGWAWVQAGCVTARLSEAALACGWRYPPDPSSLQISTIGGNVSTNAGGPHCLGYGVTSNYVLDFDFVTASGDLKRIGSAASLDRNLDLRGLVVGSEGTFGVVTAVRVRLIRQPECIRTYHASFADIHSAVCAMLAMFERAIVPIALELVWSALLPNVNGFTASGRTFMFIEMEGCLADVDFANSVIDEVIRDHRGEGEVLEKASLMEKRLALSIQRIEETRQHSESTRYFLFDAVVPREHLLSLMHVIEDICSKYRFPITNTFHAGDGNVHPALFFKSNEQDLPQRLSVAWREMLEACNQLGGALTGEHGIGIEKRDMLSLFINDKALQVMRKLKMNLGSPLCNPGKVIASGSAHERRHATQEPFITSKDRILVSVTGGFVEVAHDVTLEELHERLRETQYCLPYEPIGGSTTEALCQLIERGCPAFRELRFGPMRDFVLGGTLRRSDGTPLLIGGRLVKDVAGYDLRKLLFGSRGRIGTIQRLTMKLVPRPYESCLVTISDPSLDVILSLARRVFFETRGLSALAILPNGSSHDIQVLVEGRPDTLTKGLATIKGLISGTPATSIVSTSEQLVSPFDGATELTCTAGQPWNLAAEIKVFSTLGVPFCATAGSRMLLTPQEALAYSQGNQPNTTLELERGVLDAFAAV